MGVEERVVNDVLDRFVDKIDFTESCWLWAGAINNTGYGVFRAEGRAIAAHRWAYETVVEPTALDLDHLCRVRNCVNPDHLEPVTRRENLLRGETLTARNAAKTHCPKDHPLTEGNLCGGMRGRKCKTCKNEAERERQRKLRSG